MTSPPRVVFFGSGSPISTHALSALAGRGDVVAVVVPGGPPVRGGRSAVRSLRNRRATGPIRALARECRASLLSWTHADAERHAEAVRALQPDLICVATFPYLLPAALLEAAPAGALGVHPSPLPRHRGPAPLFWTYFDDDADAGVSVFRLDAGTDTGGLVRQETFALARGRLGSDLYLEIARRGASLLGEAVAAVSAGRAALLPQDESHASHEPSPRPGTWRIDFETWGRERVWHFLRGVGEGGRILCDGSGRALTHGPARSLVAATPARPPGTVEHHTDGWIVHCLDGRVEVSPR